VSGRRPGCVIVSGLTAEVEIQLTNEMLGHTRMRPAWTKRGLQPSCNQATPTRTIPLLCSPLTRKMAPKQSRMNEPDIDIDTLRRSRRDRFAAWFSEVTGEITHRGWPTTNATVLECRPVRTSRHYWHSIYRIEPPLLTGFVVSFSYRVNDRTYTGVLESLSVWKWRTSSTSATIRPTMEKTTLLAQAAVPESASQRSQHIYSPCFYLRDS